MKLYNKIRRKLKAGEYVQPLHDSDIAASPATRPQSSSGQIPKKAEFKPKNLWQLAWEELDAKDQQVLAGGAAKDDQTGHVSTVDLVDQVIQSTEASYKDYQKRASSTNGGKSRDFAHRILDATLSFKGIISAAVAFDPTGHASSAWTVVSLGLTMTQNHHEIRIAVFESSAFLTDRLARCAFVENEYYRDNHLEDKSLMENALTMVYKGLLQYAAQLRSAQQLSGGKRLLESLSSATDHPLKQLETKIISDEEKLHTWVSNDTYLRHKKKADEMLTRIDESIALMKGLHRKLDLNNLRSADGASFDSYLNQHEDECLPGTRVDLLQQIYDWADAPQSQSIFWLNGMAGTGKSTISRTVARVFKEQQRLGASFFFKKGEADRGNAKRFFPTLTRQLVTTIPDIAPFVLEAIESDPDIATRSFIDQFTMLLLQPLCNITPDKRQENMIIVIDALDECDGDDDIKLLLRLLPRFERAQQIKIRSFVTSRPELPIRLGFQTDEVRGNHQDLILHEVPKPVIKEDLSLFLKHWLSQIQIDRSLPEGWLSDSDFINLVTMSVPLFIFAATVCRVFEDPDLLPMESLRDILAHQNEESRLDATYLPVLQRLLSNLNSHGVKTRDKLIEEFREIVGTILILETPLSVTSLSKLLCLSREKVDLRLNRLHAVLQIPDGENEPVRIFHLSFRDFLLDPENRDKTDLFVDSGLTNQKTLGRCLDVMKRGLKKNICKLEFEGMLRANIDSDTISNSIPAELQYCCRYWTHHLEKSANTFLMMQEASAFLHDSFLYWVEAMCILGYVLEVTEEIERLQNISRTLQKDEIADTMSFLYDAQRFLLKYQHIADETPLQSYCAGLLFSPERSIIRERFISNMPEWICQYPKVEENWSADLQVLEGHEGTIIHSLAFSADGKWLASGSLNSSINIWNAKTGALHLNMCQGTDPLNSVTFSPDCRWLASASSYGTVQVWDTEDGTLRHKLRGHINLSYRQCSVGCVAFSKTGRFLASGSAGNIIEIWNPEAGILLRTLWGHTERVNSVDFSSDERLVSASWDGSINIWNPETGELKVAIKDPDAMRKDVSQDPMGYGISVKFSPDARWLASISDHAVRVWDSETGTLQRTIQGQGDELTSLSFSPDGQWLVAGSLKSIKVWDFQEGRLHRSFKENLKTLFSIAFSSDGKWLASGSWATITIWDSSAVKDASEPNTTQSKGPDILYDFDGTQVVNTGQGVDVIEFSHPDGRLLASGSRSDVGIWDPESGNLEHIISTGDRSVGCIALSHPNTRFLASSDGDGCIGVWDLELKAKTHALKGDHDITVSLAFSYTDARWLASGSLNAVIQVWDLENGTARYTLEGHGGTIRCLAFSPSDANLLVCGRRDGPIEIWDLKTGSLKHTLDSDDQDVKCVAWSYPCGRWLASWSADTILIIWNPETAAMRRKILFEDEIESGNESMMEIDGETLEFNTTLSLGADRGHFMRPKNADDVQMCLRQNWIFIKGKPVICLPYHHRPKTATFSGSRLAMGYEDGTVSFIKFRY